MVGIITKDKAQPRDELIMDLVHRRGIRQVGRGMFASVFAVPKEKTVIKVCRDKAYLAFIRMVVDEHHDNPWFPQIVSAEVCFPKKEPWYFVVEMERLRKGTSKELYSVVQLLDVHLDEILLIGKALQVSSIKLKHLAHMRAALRKLFKKFGPDFHSGNIMFRGKQPVIIDPIVSGDGTAMNTVPL
jgi:hypothetical protein